MGSSYGSSECKGEGEGRGEWNWKEKKSRWEEEPGNVNTPLVCRGAQLSVILTKS